MEACPDLEGKSSASCKSGLRPELIEALERAAPVYRAHWWAEHDRANRAMDCAGHSDGAANGCGTFRTARGNLSETLAGRTGCAWTWCGTEDRSAPTRRSIPTHVTISSHDARNQGIYGFEVLFHESSHALAGAVTEAIAREFRDRDKPIPRDLWHALLFYTTGEMVRRDLAYGRMTLASLQGRGSGQLPALCVALRALFRRRGNAFAACWTSTGGPTWTARVSFDTAIARLAVPRS